MKLKDSGSKSASDQSVVSQMLRPSPIAVPMATVDSCDTCSPNTTVTRPVMSLEEIIKHIATGGDLQNQALHALYRLKAVEFKRYFLFKGVQPDAVEDVLQDTFVKIFKSAKAYHGKGGNADNSAAAWLHQIRFTCMQDYFDKHNRWAKQATPYEEAEHQSRLEAIGADAAANSAITQSVNECVAAGLEDFAAEHPHRYDALMAVLDGEEIASLATRIGRTVAATKEYLSQCRKKLAPFIAHCTELLPA